MIIGDDRYERLRMIGWWDQQRLERANIVVVGAGALGNEVLKNLALLGIGNTLVIDFDRIEVSNLSRSVLFREIHDGQPKAVVAAKMAMELNPDCRIAGRLANVLTEVGLGVIRDADLVICCVDNREARLWINRMCWKVSTPWIDGGIQEINGVAKVFVPPNGACYECAMTENDYRLIQLRYSCPLLKREDMQQGKVPTAPTIASIIGGLQVQEALKLLHGLPSAEGSALVFNGIANKFYQTRYPIRPDCMSHETYEEILSGTLSAGATTVTELFQFVRGETNLEPEQLELDRDFLTSFACNKCARQTAVNRPIASVSMTDAKCSTCGDMMRSESIHEVVPAGELASRTLSELGVPDYDIVKVNCGARRVFVLLNGDRPNRASEE